MGKTIRAWALFIGILLIPVVAIAAHFIQTNSSAARKNAKSERAASISDESSTVGQRFHESDEPLLAAIQPQQLPQAQPQASQNPAPTSEPSTAPQPTAHPRKTEADREAELETAFQAAGPAGAFEKVLDGKLRKLFDTRQMDSLNCRDAHCRMELSFSDAASAEKKIVEVFMAADYDLGVAATISSRTVTRGGTMAVRVYLYRENDSAPEVGNE